MTAHEFLERVVSEISRFGHRDVYEFHRAFTLANHYLNDPSIHVLDSAAKEVADLLERGLEHCKAYLPRARLDVDGVDVDVVIRYVNLVREWREQIIV